MDLIFRKANYDDVEQIVDLCNECFGEQTNVGYAREVFDKTKDDENQIYLVGILDGKIVAHTRIVIIPTMFDPMRTYAILNHVCVKPDYRRHNIGTKMLIECEQICKKMNCVEMKLWSKNFRVAAHECYKHYGFNVIEATFFEKKVS